MTTGCSFTFTATVRVIDRIHNNTANGRTNAAPTHRASLTDLAQVVLAVAHFTHGCSALDMHTTNFAGTQTDLSVSAFTCHQHDASAGGTRHLRPFARQHLNAVHRS